MLEKIEITPKIKKRVKTDDEATIQELRENIKSLPLGCNVKKTLFWKIKLYIEKIESVAYRSGFDDAQLSSEVSPPIAIRRILDYEMIPNELDYMFDLLPVTQDDYEFLLNKIERCRADVEEKAYRQGFRFGKWCVKKV